MPIYEYEATGPGQGCKRCKVSFEVLQGLHDLPLNACPSCGEPVRRRISITRVRVHGGSSGKDPVERQVADYERQGLFSHAAELADKVSEKPERANLKERAMENYKRAGYDV